MRGLSIILALPIACWPASSSASRRGAGGFDAIAERSPLSVIRLAASGSPAPDLPAPEELTKQKCYSRWCFHDKDGRVAYWAEEYQIDIPQGFDVWGRRRKPIEKRVVFTGGYASVIAKQEEYNSWLKTAGLNPNDRIPPTGSLNLRTLAIPYLKSRVIINRQWERFQDDCGKASTSMYAVPGCNSGGIEWFHDQREAGKVFVFPDGMLGLRAEAIRDAWKASLALLSKVEELAPLTRASIEEKNHDPSADWRWPRNFPKDHIEPNDPPNGFIPGLAAAERRLWTAVEDAGLFEETRR